MIEVKGDVSAVVETGLDPAATLFSALGDRSRLVIVQHLLLGEHRVRDLTEHLGLAQSTVSKHLACLLGCGLVKVRSSGRASIYSLAQPAAIRILLAAAGDLLPPVASCPPADAPARAGQ